MTDVDTALTDYAIVVLCAWFLWRLRPRPHQSPIFQKLWSVFFLSILLAALMGGIVHAHFLDEASLGYRILWPATLLSIGLTAASAWGLAGAIFNGPTQIKKWLIFAGGLFVLYVAVVLFRSQEFIVAIIHYVPATVALFAASVRAYKVSRNIHYIWIASGLLITFLAAYIQMAKIGLHPHYFGHNATYHLIQAIGLFVMYRGARSSVFRDGDA